MLDSVSQDVDLFVFIIELILTTFSDSYSPEGIRNDVPNIFFTDAGPLHVSHKLGMLSV